MAQTIQILDRKENAFIPATFHDNVTIDQMNQAEAQWKPIRDRAVQRLLATGMTRAEVQRLIQHAHWDWSQKARFLMDKLLAIRCFGIELNGQWQGLAMLELTVHFAQLQPDRGKALVCIEFLETAPWNIADSVSEPRYGLREIGGRTLFLS